MSTIHHELHALSSGVHMEWTQQVAPEACFSLKVVGTITGSSGGRCIMKLPRWSYGCSRSSGAVVVAGVVAVAAVVVVVFLSFVT